MDENIFRSWLSQHEEGDPAHDLQHIERVVRNAKALASAESCNLTVLIPAAWLHDCVHVAKDSPDRAKASVMAADRAIELLAEWEFPRKHFEDIHHAITAHSFSANIEARTLEAKVLQDADRIDALGAFGLSRCLMLGGHFGSELLNPNDPFCVKREPEDKRYAVDHFFAKLFTLENTMKTTAGKKLAHERTEFLRTFLRQLAHESGLDPDGVPSGFDFLEG